jgi:DNA-binding transcriptional ArsR family regulator
MNKIIIDRPTLKAIAVDTRLDILKSLGQKQKTLSDLSKELNKNPSTLKEHLDILINVGLINKNNIRKWKYYNLTFKGINLINPKETKALLSMVLSSVLTIGLFLFFIVSFTQSTYLTNVAEDRSYSQESDYLNIMGDISESEIPANQYNEQQQNIDLPPVNKKLIYVVILITLFLFTSYAGINYYIQKNKRKKGV